MNKIGLLTSIAIGDSFGRAFEFAVKEKVEKEFDLTKYSPGVGKYPDEYIGGIGKYTDDTQMSIAIAEHMLNGYPMTHDFYAHSFMEAYNRDKRKGYSKRVQNLLDISNNVKEFNFNVSAMKPRNSNGSVMRCLPLGYYQDIDLIKHACVVQTTTTHPNLDCILATQAVAISAHYLIYGIKQTYASWMSDQLGANAFLKVFDYYLLYSDVKCDALETASFCLNIIFRPFRFVPMYSSSILNKMSKILTECVKTGGDVDSTAAICLGLATLKNIENDLSDNLFNNLENGTYGRDYIIELDKKLLEKYKI